MGRTPPHTGARLLWLPNAITIGRLAGLPILLAVLMAREVIVIGGFAALLRHGIEMRVDLAGKISSMLTMVGAGGAIWLDQAWVDGLFWAAVAVALAGLPGVIVGSIVGERGFRRLDPPTFRRVILGMLFLSGVVALLGALWS